MLSGHWVKNARCEAVRGGQVINANYGPKKTVHDNKKPRPPMREAWANMVVVTGYMALKTWRLKTPAASAEGSRGRSKPKPRFSPGSKSLEFALQAPLKACRDAQKTRPRFVVLATGAKLLAWNQVAEADPPRNGAAPSPPGPTARGGWGRGTPPCPTLGHLTRASFRQGNLPSTVRKWLVR